MDFGEWSDAILRRFVRDYELAGMNRTIGLGEHDIATGGGWPLYKRPPTTDPWRSLDLV